MGKGQDTFRSYSATLFITSGIKNLHRGQKVIQDREKLK